jgi:hypothetical protein
MKTQHRLMLGAAIAGILASAQAAAVVCNAVGPSCLNPPRCDAFCQAQKLCYISKPVASKVTAPIALLPAAPTKGTTKATIHAQFPKVIVYNFTYNPTINTTVTSMADIYLARLTRQYYIETAGAVAPLMHIAAIRLSAANLLRFKSAMGQAATDAAVNSYATPAVKAAYFSGIAKAPIRRSQAMYLSMGIKALTPSPNLDMTVYEIFLDYYTAGETSAAAALASTGMYTASYLGAAFTVGYQIGTGIFWVDDQIDAGINNWIGDELGAAVGDVVDYVSSPDNYPYYDDGSTAFFGSKEWDWDVLP